MTTVTIEQIQAEHTRLGALIAALQAPPATTTYEVPGAQIELRPGERYAGLVLAADGTPSHHLVLLPGEAEDVTWTAAPDWAAKAGGELPTRHEQAMLYANLKAEFKPRWYWSAEEVEGHDGSCAWGTYFYDGGQSFSGKSFDARARAVRRFTA